MIYSSHGRDTSGKRDGGCAVNGEGGKKQSGSGGSKGEGRALDLPNKESVVVTGPSESAEVSAKEPLFGGGKHNPGISAKVGAAE